MSLLELLGISRAKRDQEPKSPIVTTLEAHLTDCSEEQVERIAAYAGLLVRVADADVDISEAERNELIDLIRERTNLTAAQARGVGALVIRQATELEGIDYALLTRTVNEFASVEEKEQLVDCLYAVATADDRISVAEDEEIRAVARALMLSHAQFIAIRQRHKDKLEVLQTLRRDQPT